MVSYNNIKLVSIGMPLYNSEKYLKRALNSLMDQDYKNFELIISDNASTDSTHKICREYINKFKTIRIHRNQRNLGVIANFKTVLKMAKGNYFMWAADDDFWSPNFISILYDELERYPGAGVAMGAVHRTDKNGSIVDNIRFCNKDNPNNKNFFEMATAVAVPPVKYNLFIYGLFRRKLLKDSVGCFSDDFFGERLLLCLIALSSRFRYVDQFIFTKTYYNVFSTRPWRSNDPHFEKEQQRFQTSKWIYTLTKSILFSQHIPLTRKTYIVGPLYRKLMKEIKVALYPYCSENLLGLWRKLK